MIDRPFSQTQAEDFFLESLEAWREAQGIEVMTLIGHSLGGYLSLAFALKYVRTPLLYFNQAHVFAL